MSAPADRDVSEDQMLSHARIWAVIDALAARSGLTPSALARRAGLDATAFNRSKRVATDGRPRWPSTESIAKVLEATGTSVSDFATLVTGASDAPVERKGSVGLTGFAEDPVAALAPHAADAHVVRLTGAAFEPLYRAGTQLVVSASEPVRPGDRILYTDSRGDRAVAEVRSFGDSLEMIGPDGDVRILPRADLAFVARILW